MSSRISTSLTRYQTGLRNVLLGPQLLAFLPAITLGGYWIGGESVLIGVAFIMPIIMAATGSMSRRPAPDTRQKDPETGLVRRSEAVATADRLLNEGPTCIGTTAAIAVGVDEFENFVERLGAGVGSSILQACADRLRTAVRENDVVARLDGPRFMILLTSGSRADLESLIQLSTRIQKAVEDPISVDGVRVFVTVSVGFCSLKRSPAETGEAVVEAAEQALEDASSNGTGTIRAFTLDIQKRARLRGATTDDLPGAIETGQIRPWYQPQISTDEGAVIGFEVLARWEHPERGLISPGEFLPAVENLGLMERLGEVMLYNALNALRTWDASGVQVPSLSLNFSAEELRNPLLVDKIRWELDRFDLGPERLTIEVLETVIAQTSSDAIIRNLRAFSEMGCLIDLDDFGTGHASIANIRRFSVGRIKIDRSFVTQIDTDLEQQNIVSAILTLADRLELETLAEGVETPSEQAVLHQLGCRFVQGYGIARPMPFDDVAGWLSDHARRIPSRDADAGVFPSAGASPQNGQQGKTA